VAVIALLAAAAATGADPAAALRAYSLRGPTFWEAQVRAEAYAGHSDRGWLAGTGVGGGLALVSVVTPASVAMLESWTALRAGVGASASIATAAPRARLTVPFSFGAMRAVGGVEQAGIWRGWAFGAALAPAVVVGGGVHGAWVRAEGFVDRVSLSAPKAPQLRLAVTAQAPVGVSETQLAAALGIAWY
jgi:hypothetical protein